MSPSYITSKEVVLNLTAVLARMAALKHIGWDKTLPANAGVLLHVEKQRSHCCRSVWPAETYVVKVDLGLHEVRKSCSSNNTDTYCDDDNGWDANRFYYFLFPICSSVSLRP